MNLKVSKRLGKSDGLIAQTKIALSKEESKSWKFKGMVESKGYALDILVSFEQVNRALRFMESLIKNLRIRGHEIEANHNETHIVIKGERIRIQLRELSKTVIPTPNDKWSSRELPVPGDCKADCVNRI